MVGQQSSLLLSRARQSWRPRHRRPRHCARISHCSAHVVSGQTTGRIQSDLSARVHIVNVKATMISLWYKRHQTHLSRVVFDKLKRQETNRNPETLPEMRRNRMPPTLCVSVSLKNPRRWSIPAECSDKCEPVLAGIIWGYSISQNGRSTRNCLHLHLRLEQSHPRTTTATWIRPAP